MTMNVTNATGKVVGSIVYENGGVSLHKRVKLANMLRTPSGWATDVDHLASLTRAAADIDCNPNDTFIALHDDTGIIWTASLAQFHDHGINVNRGHGKQRCLPIRLWRTTSDAQMRMTFPTG